MKAKRAYYPLTKAEYCERLLKQVEITKELKSQLEKARKETVKDFIQFVIDKNDPFIRDFQLTEYGKDFLYKPRTNES